jgi:hypothetical protein
MIYTLKDGREFCAAQIDGGREWFDDKCRDRINEAEMILMQEVKTIDLRRVARFYVDAGKTFALPEMVESVLKVNFNSVQGNVRGMGYEFMDSGPGPEWTQEGRGMGLDLRDLGDNYPTFYPIGAIPYRIIAISDDSRDYGATIRLRGFDAFNTEINPKTPGEMVRIGIWQNQEIGVIDFNTIMPSQNEFQQLTSVVKPETFGNVSLYGYEPASNNLIFLSRYMPHETQPGYRRYEITNKSCCSESYIHALVRLRHVKLRNDTDPLTIQNLMALRYMCQSLHQQNMGNVSQAVTFQSQAIRALSKQSENKSTEALVMDFDVDMGYGSIPAI